MTNNNQHKKDIPHHKKDAFEEETSLFLYLTEIFQGFLVFLAIVIWLLSIFAGDFYLGRYLNILSMSVWLKAWFVPSVIILLSILGLLAPLFIFFIYDRHVEKEMPAHLRNNNLIKAVRNSVIVVIILCLLVAPLFLALLIYSVLGNRISKIILGLSLIITFVLILRNIGFTKRLKYFLKHWWIF